MSRIFSFICFFLVYTGYAQTSQDVAEKIRDFYKTDQSYVIKNRQRFVRTLPKVIDWYQVKADFYGDISNLNEVLFIRASFQNGEEAALLALAEGICTSEPLAVDNTYNYLHRLRRTFYKQRIVDSLYAWRIRLNFRSEEYVKILGFVGDLDLHGEYLKNLKQSAKSQKLRWNTTLALARLGDQDAINECKKKFKQFSVNSDFVYSVVPDMLYTCQSAIYEFLVEGIMSDAKGCYNANPERDDRIMCAYRLIEQIAPYFDDYPYQLDVANELDVEDYRIALHTVREWLENQNGSYNLNCNRY